MKDRAIGFDCVFEDSDDVRRWLGGLAERLGSGWRGHVTELYTVKNDRLMMLEEEDAFPVDHDDLQNMGSRDFYAIHLVMHLYSGEHSLEHIDDYKEYLRSDCEMIVLVVDAYYLELYCKDPALLRDLTALAKAIPGAKLEEKTEENDGRYRMYV